MKPPSFWDGEILEKEVEEVKSWRGEAAFVIQTQERTWAILFADNTIIAIHKIMNIYILAPDDKRYTTNKIAFTM